ncbi:hypothetical protein [Mycobacteroides abscessus]|uniref:hypothetical protein n=1 Tax=Mycobacteroides abscessus TaxID=36809 RepID=UPI002104D329
MVWPTDVQAPLLERNWDSQARAFGGQRADRLLHGICNSQRQDGRHDAHRPVVLDVHPSEWSVALAELGIAAAPVITADNLAMDW